MIYNYSLKMAHAESLSRSPPPIPLSIAQITVIIKHLAKKNAPIYYHLRIRFEIRDRHHLGGRDYVNRSGTFPD